jgi:AcrR family transcriptional regulator
MVSEMTDSISGQAPAVGRRPGKRERLIAAALQLLHQQGIERTTLADIAKAADVPAGNVYYYFKTKDEVIAAVIEAHARQIKTTLAFINAHHRSPKTRLKASVREFTAQGEIVARYGCPSAACAQSSTSASRSQACQSPS